MMHVPNKRRRRSMRLADYDYSQDGAYFVTICTQGRVCLFGDIVDRQMRLSLAGKIVDDSWRAMVHHFPLMELDEFVVMPNHIHGVVRIAESGRGTACRALTMEQFGHPVPGSLPTIIRSFKSATTKRINLVRGIQGRPVWQRNYYEHVIRNEAELDRVRQYVLGNPGKWQEDTENPDNLGKSNDT